MSYCGCVFSSLQHKPGIGTSESSRAAEHPVEVSINLFRTSVCFCVQGCTRLASARAVVAQWLWSSKPLQVLLSVQSPSLSLRWTPPHPWLRWLLTCSLTSPMLSLYETSTSQNLLTYYPQNSLSCIGLFCNYLGVPVVNVCISFWVFSEYLWVKEYKFLLGQQLTYAAVMVTGVYMCVYIWNFIFTNHWLLQQ